MKDQVIVWVEFANERGLPYRIRWIKMRKNALLFIEGAKALGFRAGYSEIPQDQPLPRLATEKQRRMVYAILRSKGYTLSV